jgi:tetratricopeptide (TPR) repeat protein
MATACETLELARQLHQAGDLAGAAVLYERIVELEPADAEVLGLLGLACHQLGRLADAQIWYARALAIRPEDAELHFRLGLVFASLERADEAADCFREAVRLRPDSPEAWNNLGNVLLLQTQTEQAIRCYREAVRLRPDYGEACLNLGRALRENDQLSEGLVWYREAVRLRPEHAKARNNLAAALLEVGELAEAELHLRASLKHRPASPHVLCALAANGLYGASDPTMDQLRVWLADAHLPLMDASQLHATLAILLDRAGQWDESFRHCEQANRLRRELTLEAGGAFDAAEHSRLVDTLLAVFTPAYFERARGWGSADDRPVFLVGMPRSGSSLVEQILSHHPDVAGVGELRDMPRMAMTLQEQTGTTDPYPECVAGLDAALARTLAERYLARVHGLVGDARRITDKLLENFMHLGLIATLLPRARVIHCRRDPLDTCVSCFFQVFQGMNFTSALGDLARYYKDYERLMAHWRQVLPLPVLDVVYEELVGDPAGVSRRMIGFCGLPWDERCLRFHENPRAVRTVSKLQVRRPIYSSSVGRWRRYSAHLSPLRQALGIPEPDQVHGERRSI